MPEDKKKADETSNFRNATTKAIAEKANAANLAASKKAGTKINLVAVERIVINPKAIV